MAKKYAIVTKERQGEAFRVALGLLLLDDEVDVYVLAAQVSEDTMAQQQFIQLKEMELPLYFTEGDPNLVDCITRDEVAAKLPDYDHVIPFF